MVFCSVRIGYILLASLAAVTGGIPALDTGMRVE
jgi:hypothetical protein